MSTKSLFTIGYEGSDLGSFLAELAAYGIEQIIDVRDVPLSRKRGFSKNSLANALAAQGVIYLHVKALGDPKPGREAARRGDYLEFRKVYNRHLKSQNAQTALQTTAKSAMEKVSCLLCFERAYENCHRNIVAKALENHTGLVVEHIFVRERSELPQTIIHDLPLDRELALG